MIGLVVVSHSRPLAEAAVALASAMVPEAERPVVAVAAGLADGVLGTDAAAVAFAIGQADSGDGVLVLVDLGSAVLSAEMALELLDPDAAARVRLSPAPLVEGLVAAVVAAAGGADLAACDAEARRGLDAKVAHLGEDAGPAPQPSSPAPPDAPATFTATVDLSHGLHLRPATAIAGLLRPLDADVRIRNATAASDWVNGASATKLLTLALEQGDVLEATASGPDADAAIAALADLARRRFGESG